MNMGDTEFPHSPAHQDRFGKVREVVGTFFGMKACEMKSEGQSIQIPKWTAEELDEIQKCAMSGRKRFDVVGLSRFFALDAGQLCAWAVRGAYGNDGHIKSQTTQFANFGQKVSMIDGGELANEINQSRLSHVLPVPRPRSCGCRRPARW